MSAEISDGGAVAGRDVSIRGAMAAGRDIVVHHQTVQTASATVMTPRELPSATAAFVDRDEHLRALCGAIEGGGDAVIGVISGPAGIGKTSLALRVAYQMEDRFPDGQLFTDLRGAEAVPLDSGVVLSEFLRALGLTSIPDGLDDRARLLRSHLANGRYLIVLDNAQGERQVRPLLPGATGSAVIVTSRSRLSLLDATHTIRLDVLSEQDAVRLLGRIAGAERVGMQEADAQRIAHSCGGFPLALRIAAARLAARPQWRLARLAERLSDERNRLRELSMGDQEARAGFALSYEALGDAERRAFRLLGSADTMDFTAWAAAFLLHTDLAAAEDLLELLVEANLLETSGDPPRYRFHDLLRAFARELAAQQVHEEEQHAALERLLAGYFAVAEAADADFSVQNSAVWDRPETGVPAELVAAAEPSRVWFDAERANVLRLVGQAARSGLARWSWRLASTMWQYLEFRSRWAEWRAVYTQALDAARLADDPTAESASLRLLGRLSLALGETEKAGTLFTAALDRLEESSAQPARAMALKDLSVVERQRNRHERAVELLDTSLEQFLALGQRYWPAAVQRELGVEYRCLAQWAQARNSFEAAKSVFVELGEDVQEAQTWFELGVLERLQGNNDAALECFGHGLPVMEAAGHTDLACWIRRETGVVQRQRGDLAEAIATLNGCLDTWRDLDNERQQAATEHELAITYRQAGQLNDARRSAEQAVRAFGDLGNRFSAARSTVTLAAIELEAGDAVESARYAREAVSEFHAIADTVWQAKALNVLAGAYGAAGDGEAAASAVEQAAQLARIVQAADDPRI